MKFNPHDYQKYATEFIETHNESAVLLDMGPGKTSITLTAINDLLFDSPVNPLRFNSKEKFLQTNNAKESEEDFEDNTNFEKNLLFHPISSKLLKFNEKRKNRIISPNKSNANKNITSK